MNLGKKIVEIRKNNKMSQEDFAEIFNVTRQTVSSWENSKSYPDIETLVKISDKFNISLDILLKEDKDMIKAIDKNKKENFKYKKILITIGIIFSIFIVSFIIYFVIYSNNKTRLEGKFNTGIKETGFKKNKDGYYVLKYKNNVTFEAPNQKMPKLLDFSLNFHAKQIDCSIKQENTNYIVTIDWLDYDYFYITLFDNKDDNVVENVDKIKYDDINSTISKKVMLEEDELKEIVKKGNKIYNTLYEYKK